MFNRDIEARELLAKIERTWHPDNLVRLPDGSLIDDSPRPIRFAMPDSPISSYRKLT